MNIRSLAARLEVEGITVLHPVRMGKISLAVFAVLFGTLSTASAAPRKPGCELEILDKCGGELFVFATSEKIAINAQELDEVCARQAEAEECARDYLKKCTESIVQGIGSIFLDDVRDEIETRCEKDSEYQKRYLEHASCLNSIGPGLHRCMRNLTLDLDTAAQLQSKHRIGGACCKFNVFETCFENAVKGKCPSGAEDLARNFVQKYSGELLSTVCAPYRGNLDKCKSIVFDDNLRGDPNIRSALTPLIKVGEALG
ncbi:uncharacterized protein LOC135397149 [Ornithodoros turicata]|uniref:uncharacterized protein LOC135397149 n=1 Tax=Ornithodoros turicata TaxID=34597 RepID=UPI003139642F